MVARMPRGLGQPRPHPLLNHTFIFPYINPLIFFPYLSYLLPLCLSLPSVGYPFSRNLRISCFPKTIKFEKNSELIFSPNLLPHLILINQPLNKLSGILM